MRNSFLKFEFFLIGNSEKNFFFKVGAKSIEEYEDILQLKNKQISNNEIIVKDIIKKYEEKMAVLTVFKNIFFLIK